MPIGSSWWRHIRCGPKLGRHACLCNMWWVWVKQWPKYLTLWLAGPVLRIIFVQYFIAFRSRLEVMSDVLLGPVVPDNIVKFGDLRLSYSREIPPEAAAFSTVFSLQLPTGSR